jgi:hypothetical protein
MYIKVNLLMVLLKAMGNIIGQMVQLIKAVINKAIEMAMDFGDQRMANSNIKVIIF